MIFTNFIYLLLFILNTKAQPSTQYIFAKNMNLVFNCSIMNPLGEVIMQVPGNHCIFFDDGSYVSSQIKNENLEHHMSILSKYDQYGLLVWKRPSHMHHQMHLSEDKKSIILLGSDYIKNSFCNAYYDTIEIISAKTGKLLYKWSTYNHLKEIIALKKKKNIFLVRYNRYYGDSHPACQLTHFNSVYEIPENKRSNTSSIFKKGNFIVNMMRTNHIAIFDKHLKKILWLDDLNYPDDAGGLDIHDVQLTKDGDILYYKNSLGSEEVTSLEIFDIDKREVKWRFPSQTQTDFFGSVGGGAQVLYDGNILYSLNSDKEGGYAEIITPIGLSLWKVYNPYTDMNTHKPFFFQDIKMQDVSAFLENHKL